MTQEPQWSLLYQAAMLELNAAQMQRTIDTARAAIDQRILELQAAGTQNNGNADEMHKLLDALQGLRTLERVECRAPAASPNSAILGTAS